MNENPICETVLTSADLISLAQNAPPLDNSFLSRALCRKPISCLSGTSGAYEKRALLQVSPNY